MLKTVAINGSPRKSKGNTAAILTPFLEGMTAAGAEVDLMYASKLEIKPCSCGSMYCWYESPGKCCFNDDMELLYPKLREAEILILATPVYIPLPGVMQNVINRLCPLLLPRLEFQEGRTRACFRPDVRLQKIVLVASGGWWEKENFGTLVRIGEELAKHANIEFAGAILRPHAYLMKEAGQFTKEAEGILKVLRKLGRDFIQEGRLSSEDLEFISRPLISEGELRQRYNQAI